MNIKDLPKVWVQENFYHPYPAFKTELEKEDGTVVVYAADLQSMEPDNVPKSAIFNTEEEANLSYNSKIQKANGLEKFIFDFFVSGPDDSWMRKKFIRNVYDSYYETRIMTLERILSAYRTNMLNIDGTSIRIDQVDSIRFTGDLTEPGIAGKLDAIFMMKSGTMVSVKLRSTADKRLFIEFFGSNASGYHLEGITPEQLKDKLKS